MDDNKFKVTGPVSKTKTGPNYAFIGLKVKGEKFDSFVDFSAFDPDMISAVERLREGDVVTLTGHISTRKDKDSGKYGTQLVATGIKADEAMAKVKAVFPDARVVDKAPF